MAEDRFLVDHKDISYSGLISISGIYKAIMKQLGDLGYNAFEERHTEEVHEDGKQILVTFKGDRKLSDFAKILWECDLTIVHAQEVTVEKGHQKVKMFKGSVNIVTSVILSTGHDKSFEQNAWLYFLRTVIDKFVFKSYVNKAASRAKKDYSQFEQRIKSFLNVESFR